MPTVPQAYRYALYLAPPEPWLAVGSRWLGRCADSATLLPRPAGADSRLDDWTEAPRLYGLHATLKAPFRLAADATPMALDGAVRNLALACQPFEVSLWRRNLRGFLAWCLADGETDSGRMRELADAAVAGLDRYRAPPTTAELARRQAQPLAPAELAMLDRWGYPYAFETFTFHITLTGKLDPPELAAAEAQFGASGGNALPDCMPVDAVSLYVQPRQDDAFIVARHYCFDGSVRDAAGACYLPASR